ncbi:MAG TPA: SIR2 family protein [Acidiferrobacter sp.]|nr:SIR2 family protein [Acidiferrobacter sp.]
MSIPNELLRAFTAGRVIPYIGPGVLATDPNCPLPITPEDLVARLTAKATVPHKIRGNLTAAAQFIENFKHRKTVSTFMTEAFAIPATPTALHRRLAAMSDLPLIVHAWYDDLAQQALRGRTDWGLIQGVSQAEHYGSWTHYFHHDGSKAEAADAEHWATLLYEPIGSVRPASNFLVSDSDFVEVLTEIDIQTPIPARVQELRRDRHILFLGCRFTTQVERTFARQIMKRSSDKHWAVLPENMTRNEARFLGEQQIEPLVMDLAAFTTMFWGGTLAA